MAGVLSRVPGLGGFIEAGQLGQQQQMSQLSQLGAVQGMLAKAQQQKAQAAALQREEQLRGALAQLPQDATPEMVTRAITPYAGPDVLLRTFQSSADRAAQREQTAAISEAARAERRAALEARLADARTSREEQANLRRELAEMNNQARRDLLSLGASLRPAPAPRPLQLTTDENGNQLIVNADGTTRPLTAQDGAGVRKPISADKPMTEFQGKASLYGTRAAQSDKILQTLEEKISLPGLEAGRSLGRAGNYFLSSEQRRVDQAQRDFVNAVLRQESGAVISDAEFDNAKRQYFPQPGDDKQTIDQKRANRKIAIDGFKRMSGPKGAVDIDAIVGAPLLPTAPSANTSSGKIGAKRLKFDANGNLVQ